MNLRTTFPTATGSIEIGDGLPSFLIAEIGLNHNGSEELAAEMIREAVEAGASFVKFQKREPAALATAAFLDAPFEKCPQLGGTQRVVRERLELSLEAYKRLRAYAESLGAVFFASAFDIPSLRFLVEAGVGIIKIASHSITNGPLLAATADTGLPVVASLGGATREEADQAVALLSGNPLVLMHCVSAYPTPDSSVYLDTIQALRERYSVPIGFSSHEAGIEISVASTVLGACMVERHFTLRRSMVGLDHKISLEPEEFAEMAERIGRLRAVRGVYGGLMGTESAARSNYHVAVCAARNIPAGTVLDASMLVCKQPLGDSAEFFTGLEVSELVGRRSSVDLSADVAIPRRALAHA
jgi:sialic acid synthase SpsE